LNRLALSHQRRPSTVPEVIAMVAVEHSCVVAVYVVIPVWSARSNAPAILITAMYMRACSIRVACPGLKPTANGAKALQKLVWEVQWASTYRVKKEASSLRQNSTPRDMETTAGGRVLSFPCQSGKVSLESPHCKWLF